MRYYIYKQNADKDITRYWDRRKQNWSKWFTSDCWYQTFRGANRVYKMRVKYIGRGETIGFESMPTIRKS